MSDISGKLLQDQLRRVGQVSRAVEAQLHEEGRAAGQAQAQAQAQAQIKALQQARAEAQTVAQHQIQALLQERDDLQVDRMLPAFAHKPVSCSSEC